MWHGDDVLVTFMRTIKGMLKRRAINTARMQMQRVYQNILVAWKHVSQDSEEVYRQRKCNIAVRNMTKSGAREATLTRRVYKTTEYV